MIYKNCDGKKIDSCPKCGNHYYKKSYAINIPEWQDPEYIVILHCKERKDDRGRCKLSPDYWVIPSWCPLEDYKEADHEKPS